MEFIESIKKNLNRFYISCGIITLGYFFIHIKMNSPPNWSLFLAYLPFTYFLAFILMCGFILFLGIGKE